MKGNNLKIIIMYIKWSTKYFIKPNYLITGILNTYTSCNYIYILELKLDKSADEALCQINDKGYAEPFKSDGRHIYKIGVNFSTETRSIDGWKIE